MALSRLRRPRKASITSLIDVIFLLLLFFMLASTFTDHAEIELVASQGEMGNEAEASILRLTVGARALSLNGAPVTLDALAPAVSAQAVDPETVLAVDPAPGADTERLVGVLLALQDVEGVAIRVVEPAR